MNTHPNILIIDDQPDNIRTLSAMLAGEGYKIRKALNGETALEAAQALSPDLILLDIMMPQMNGYEVCSALKATKATREIPVIFLSALSEISDKTQAFRVGGSDYITKPFQIEEVLLRVSHQLTIRSQRRELVEQTIRLQREIAQRQCAEAIVQRQAQQERLLGKIIDRIRQSLQINEILTIAVTEIRQFMQADQVFICRFNPDWSGHIVAESINAEHLSLLGQTFDSLPWQQYWQELFRQGPPDIYAAVDPDTLQVNYAEVLANSQIRVSLSLPILHPDAHWGIVVAHHGFTPRTWMEWEVKFLQQCTAQLAIAIQHSELYHQLEKKVQERTANLQQALKFETLRQHITDRVRDSLDEPQIWQTAVEQLCSGLAIEGCEASLYSADRATSTLTYASGSCKSPAIGRALPIATDILHHQLLQKQIFQFCGYPPDSTQQPYAGYSILVYPIFDDQHILGSLWLFKQANTGFTDLEIRLVKQVKTQCAIALRQSRLYQAAQTQVKELQYFSRLKDDFLSTLSHELRTPISNITLLTHLLLIATSQNQAALETPVDADQPSTKIAYYLDILQAECDRELNLIQDLLNLQHLEAGTQPLNPTPIDLTLWLFHVIEPFESRCLNQQQTLQVTCAPDLPWLTTDSFCLRRILTELLNNACKYTPARETITIATDVEAETMVISITNSGVEIPAEKIDLVFEKSYRIPDHDPWRQGGAGLGLALVQKLVNHLNGSIQANSGNNLTCFTVTLPLLLEPPSR